MSKIVPRPVGFGKFKPAIIEIPVYHNERVIGVGTIGPQNRVVIDITSDFDASGIARMFMNEDPEGLTLGIHNSKENKNATA